jgi:hypothetical protein
LVERLSSVIDFLTSNNITNIETALNQQPIAEKINIREGWNKKKLDDGPYKSYLAFCTRTRPKKHGKFYGIGGTEKAWYLTDKGLKIAPEVGKARMTAGEIEGVQSGDHETLSWKNNGSG